jgi:hypothetical protein
MQPVLMHQVPWVLLDRLQRAVRDADRRGMIVGCSLWWRAVLRVSWSIRPSCSHVTWYEVP